jgi:small subunit ribosomal protein S6
MAKYELMLIVRPDVAEEEVDKLLAQMEGVVTAGGGKVEKVEKMGRRRLAYRVRKQREGFYVLLAFESGGAAVRELERRLKVIDSVIKYMTIRMDEEIQRAQKFKARMARQEARRPKPKAAATGAPGVEAPAREAQPRSE